MLFPERLREPTIVAGMLIPGASDYESFQAIRRLERPPLNRYQLARDLVLAVLKGKEFEWALHQARQGHNPDQRAHAISVLMATERFLRLHSGRFLGESPRSSWLAGKQLALPNMPGALIGDASDRSIILFHFWQGEIPSDRLPLVTAASRRAVWSNARLIGVPVNILSAPLIDAIGQRRTRVIECTSGGAEDETLSEFGVRLEDLWERYHIENPDRQWAPARKSGR